MEYSPRLCAVRVRLQARDPDAQQIEAAIGAAVLNRMLAAAHLKSVRCKAHWRIPWREVGKREPDDVRASRPLLREPRGEIPRGYSPLVLQP